MRSPRFLALLLLALVAVLPTGAASAASTGGTSADAADGEAGDGGRTGALVFGAPPPRRPVVKLFSVAPRAITEGTAPRIRVRIDEPGVRTVTARIVVLGSDRRAAARIDLGRMRTGRVLDVRWPRGKTLSPGEYLVRLHAKDPDGAVLARAANATGKASLSVRPRPRPEKSLPEPQTQPTPAAQSGGVFPVAGPHTFGGDGSRFGAGRPGHIHEGQDISAASGTPVVAPVAGTISHVAFQPAGAGHYVVLTADDGRAMFFAHLQTGSIPVAEGARVTAGTVIGRVGNTGASSGPHLHFEIWAGGWRDRGGKPVDPLSQLQAWDR